MASACAGKRLLLSAANRYEAVPICLKLFMQRVNRAGRCGPDVMGSMTSRRTMRTTQTTNISKRLNAPLLERGRCQFIYVFYSPVSFKCMCVSPHIPQARQQGSDSKPRQGPVAQGQRGTSATLGKRTLRRSPSPHPMGRGQGEGSAAPLPQTRSTLHAPSARPTSSLSRQGYTPA